VIVTFYLQVIYFDITSNEYIFLLTCAEPYIYVNVKIGTYIKTVYFITYIIHMKDDYILGIWRTHQQCDFIHDIHTEYYEN
jgi:hypothetical protein